METAMDAVHPISSKPVQKPSWNPLKCDGTDLPTNLTIMVKALAFVLVVVNHVTLLPYPWLPFIPALDAIPGALFQRTLQVVFIIGLFLVVFNRRVRLGALLLGTVLLISVVSSKVYYGNNKTFCGLVLLLAGLYQPGAPNFLRWQLILTYFGAGLNKVLDPDWHTGVFFEHWAVVRLQQPVYLWVNSLLPPMWLARFMCWATIATELGTIPLLIFPQLFVWGIIANISFQACLMFFVGETFGLFTYAMCAASFAFVTWPTSPIPVVYDPGRGFAERARRFFKAWDLDRRFLWTPYRPEVGAKYGIPSLAAGEGLRIVVGKKVYGGFRAIRMIVLLNPITYFIIGMGIGAFDHFPPASGAFYRRLVGGMFLVLLMPPLAWIADMKFGGKEAGPARTRPVAIEN
jgi:hypothetical protein